MPKTAGLDTIWPRTYLKGMHMRIRSIKPEFWRSNDLDPHNRQSFKEFGTAPPGQDFIYRLYDHEMNLLYVGITWNPFVRWTDHSKTKTWWESVAYADVHLCADNRDARSWETWCIKNQNPVHNKHQNRRWHRGTNQND